MEAKEKIDSDIKFDVKVNAFTRSATFVSNINGCEYIRVLYFELDEWNSFEMDGNLFDVHFMYDEKFSVYIYPVFDGEVDCTQEYDVNLTILTKDYYV
jgi:hypothetical protein